MRDSIDFGSMNISTLFRKLLIPTVLGMIFSAVFVITDGIVLPVWMKTVYPCSTMKTTIS